MKNPLRFVVFSATKKTSPASRKTTAKIHIETTQTTSQFYLIQHLQTNPDDSSRGFEGQVTPWSQENQELGGGVAIAAAMLKKYPLDR